MKKDISSNATMVERKEKKTPSRKKTNQKQLIFIRHGKSQAQEAAQKGLDRTDKSLLDCGLAYLGTDQAYLLRKWFDQFDPNEVFILCSPLKRALQTALIAFPDQKIKVHPNLIEIPGTIPENKPRPLSKLSRDPDLNSLPGWESIDWSELPEEWPINKKNSKQNTRSKQISKKQIRKQINREVLDFVSSCNERTVILVCHYNVIRSFFPEVGGHISNCVPLEAHLSTSDLKHTDDDTKFELEFIGINKLG